VLIAVVVAMALVVGDRTDASKTKATYTEFLQQVQAGEVSKATILGSAQETGKGCCSCGFLKGDEFCPGSCQALGLQQQLA